jgi:hypothetical protein
MSRRRSRPWVWGAYLVYLVLLVDVGARLGLAFLVRFRHISYRPVPIQGLDDTDRRMIDAIIADDPQTCLDFDAQLGWALRRSICANEEGVRGPRTYT